MSRESESRPYSKEEITSMQAEIENYWFDMRMASSVHSMPFKPEFDVFRLMATIEERDREIALLSGNDQDGDTEGLVGEPCSRCNFPDAEPFDCPLLHGQSAECKWGYTVVDPPTDNRAE